MKQVSATGFPWILRHLSGRRELEELCDFFILLIVTRTCFGCWLACHLIPTPLRMTWVRNNNSKPRQLAANWDCVLRSTIRFWPSWVARQYWSFWVPKSPIYLRPCWQSPACTVYCWLMMWMILYDGTPHKFAPALTRFIGSPFGGWIGWLAQVSIRLTWLLSPITYCWDWIYC